MGCLVTLGRVKSRDQLLVLLWTPSATGWQALLIAPGVEEECWRETAWHAAERRKEHKCESTNPTAGPRIWTAEGRGPTC